MKNYKCNIPKSYKMPYTNKKGNMFIDYSILILLAMFLLMFFLNVTSVVMLKQKTNDFANELLRTAEIYGNIGTETTNRAKELKETYNISPKITWTPSSGKVQLLEKIKVKVEVDSKIGLSTIVQIPLKISSSATGMSEVYYKTL